MLGLIIGAGEVGNALYRVLVRHYTTYLRDKEEINLQGQIKILHICYPWQKDFVRITKNYLKQYQPKYAIIHSTVPIGISKKCGTFHSPIRGRHPELEKSLHTFVKYLASRSDVLANYFQKAGITIKMFDKPETTELLKILDTAYYGWNIVFCKEIKRICNTYKLDFDEVYTLPNISYNLGYTILGMSHVSRPVLTPIDGKIGGHCVIPNCKLLNDKITKLILKFNQSYEKIGKSKS